MNAKNILICLVALLVVGCGMEFRSPVVLKRTPKEEEKKPRPEKIVPPPPLITKKQGEAVPEPTEPEGEPVVPTEVISMEEPTVPPELPEDIPPAGRPVSVRLPQGRSFVVSAKSIVILSTEYLKSTPYNVLEKITVQDVSQNGFTKQEAREALQFEAYRRFGSRANAIINVEYKEKTDFIPGSHRYAGVSGEVITWQEAALPPKTEPTPPAPEPVIKPEPEPLTPAPEIQPEITPETKPEAKPAPSVPPTKAESPALGPSTAAKPEAEPVAPVAPPISEQPLEN